MPSWREQGHVAITFLRGVTPQKIVIFVIVKLTGRLLNMLMSGLKSQ
jgi:hypothetical protein